MFKLNVPITAFSKSKRDSNVLVIEGFASDPTIDRDNERFSEGAITKMAEYISKGDVKIKVEHENKFYSEIGVWKEATLIGDKLFVKGEIDLDMSLGRDIEVLLMKGKTLGLSVGGKVLEAISEYSKELGKHIKVYTDVFLKEISVVMNPASYSTTLGIAKSYDITKNEETEEAKEIETLSEAKVEAEFPAGDTELILEKSCTYMDRVKNKNMKKAFEEIDTLIVQKYDDECCVEYDEYSTRQLDMQTLITVVKIIKEIDFDNIEMPKKLMDWEYVNDLPAESFVIGIDGRYFPHHDEKFQVQMDWVKYRLCALVCNQNYSRLRPKEFSIALQHLYHHYKETMTKSTKVEATQAVVKNVSKEVYDNSATLSEKDIELMKGCYDFFMTKSGQRPQIEGNDLSDKDIHKMASAYSTMMQRKASAGSLGARMAGTYRTPISTNQSGVADGQAEVAKSEGDETEKKEEVVTAEATPEAEVTETPAEVVSTEAETKSEETTTDTQGATEDEPVTKEANADAETVKEEVAVDAPEKAPETVVEAEVEGEATTKDATETEEVVAQAPAEDVSNTEDVAPATEEVKEAEAPVEKGLTEEAVTALFTKLFDEKVQPMLDTINKQVSNLSTELEKSNEVTKGFSEAKDKDIDAVAKSLLGVATNVEELIKRVNDFGNLSQGRKSIAGHYAIVEKSSEIAEKDAELTEEQKFQKAVNEEMDKGLTLAQALATVKKAQMQ